MKRIDPQFLKIIQPLNFPSYSPLRTQTRSIATNYAGGDSFLFSCDRPLRLRIFSLTSRSVALRNEMNTKQVYTSFF